jgi:hypothetical protein
MKQVNADKRLIKVIDQILSEHPNGVSEYDLIDQLNRQHGSLYPKPDLSDQLLLFQHHFYLRHCLYLLQDELSRQGDCYLDINAVTITKRLSGNISEKSLSQHDPLRDYYLDLSNLNKETRTSVTSMLDNFWVALSKYQVQPEALAELGLSGSESPEEQKRQFKRLAQQHHPDKGGDPEKFNDIQNAWEKLKK